MLIVLGIIALLMGLAIMSMGGINDTAKIQKARGDILNLREGLAAYELDCGSLPTTQQGLSVLWSKPTIEPIPAQWHKIMDNEVLDPWHHSYQYLNPGKHNPDKYDLFSMGPSGQPDAPDAIGNWSETASDKP